MARSVEGSEFFKVFLPQRSSHQLSIPPEFTKKFKRTMKEKVILKNAEGKKWYVDVKETLDGVFLKDGWPTFVDYHGLKAGDFLVFRYDRGYSFLVKIFGINGCKKEAVARRVKSEEGSEEKTDEKTKPQQASGKRTAPQIKHHLSSIDKRSKLL